MWQLPPMWPLAVPFVSHHSQYCTLHLHLRLIEFISHLRIFECLKSWACCLAVCCKERCRVPPVKNLVCVSTELSSAVRSLTLVEAYSVFLSFSQHTQPPSLFTKFSQEWLWKLAVGNRHSCQEGCATPSQIQPNSAEKWKRSAESEGEAWISVFPIVTQCARPLYCRVNSSFDRWKMSRSWWPLHCQAADRETCFLLLRKTQRGKKCCKLRTGPKITHKYYFTN